MGDYSKQPFINAVFLNNQNIVNSNPRNEKVAGFELGYGYTSEKFKANLNVYRTEWKDRFKSVGYRDGNIRGTADLQGIKQLHTGVELDFTYEISDNFRFVGMASVGDWEYAGNVSGTAFDQDLQAVGTVDLYLDGVKVGNSAQTTARLGFDWEVTDNFKIDYSHRYAAKLYADINTADFDSVDNEGSLQLPSYFLGDVGMSYKFDFRDNSDLKLRLNINNVGNTEYISESLTNNFVEPGDDSYQGINTNNKAFFGFGTTWNFTVRYNF
jgi:outer membrane receptor for Fe3+-dicitrate